LKKFIDWPEHLKKKNRDLTKNLSWI